MGVGGKRHAPTALPPRKWPGTQLNRSLVGPQGPFGRVQKIWPSPEFDPRTVQPVVSRSTAELSRPSYKINHSFHISLLYTQEAIYRELKKLEL